MMNEKNFKSQLVVSTVIGTLISLASISLSIYNSHRQVKRQRRKELESLYEKMLSTIPKEKVIMTKSDIFDESDNLINSGMSVDAIVKTLNIRKSQSSGEACQKIDMQIEAINKYDSYWQHYSNLISDFEDELRLKTNIIDKDILELYLMFVVAFHNEHFYRGPVINTKLLREKHRQLEQAIIKHIY